MPTEDELTVPAQWRRLVHPRRVGIRPEPPSLSQADRDRFIAAWAAQQSTVAGVLTDPDLIAAVRAGPETVAGAGVIAALACHFLTGEESVLLVDQWVADRGPSFAAAALAESVGLMVDEGRRSTGTAQPAVLHRVTAKAEREERSYPMPPWTRLAKRLRVHLALLPDDDYAAVIDALQTFRSGQPRQRALTTYLIPERRDWFEQDAPLSGMGHSSRKMLFFSAATDWEMLRFRPTSADGFVTAVDVLGSAAAPLLARWYGDRWTRPEGQTQCVEVLARIPTDEAFTALLDRISYSDVAPALLIACELFPRRAARLLAERTDEWSATLLRRHLLGHRELPEAKSLLAARAPEAAASEVPALLREPPWSRPRVDRIVELAPADGTAVIEWQDGEQARWGHRRWGSFKEDWAGKMQDLAAGRLQPWEQVDLLIYGPAELIRPLLPSWQPVGVDTYWRSLKPIVASYGLDALPLVLKFARAKPQIGADLLLPYRSAEIAWMMADWQVRSRAVRPIASAWFERHGADGAAMLIPRALGGNLKERRSATVAVLRLDPDVVRRGAEKIGCADHVEALLAIDPLELVPARVPVPPAWLDPNLLPQILLAGDRGVETRRALAAEHVRVLLSMVAISGPHQVYDGLVVVAGSCDPASLSRFAWELFRLWELVGRPSRYAWAFDALGYLGDDDVVEALVPLVRRWPTDGAMARARRGVDALGGIGTDNALYHLSRLARSAKSLPLRVYSAAELERAGLERGLLPEQLADRLVPDLDLSSDGTRISYRGTEYTSFVADDGELKLRTEAGKVATTLPKPVLDAEKESAGSWRGLRKKANAVLREQSGRLETAMIDGRTWTTGELQTVLLSHPLLSELARRLVWLHGDQPVTVESDIPETATGLDVDGRPVVLSQLVRIAHPVEFDAGPWRQRFADLALVQPFAQLERETYSGATLDGAIGRVVATRSVIGLTRHGWEWSSREQAAMRYSLTRSISSGFEVELHIEPGSSAATNAEPEQTLTRLDVTTTDGATTAFEALPPISRSELLRDLNRLR